MGKSLTEVMQQQIFDPLEMTTAGASYRVYFPTYVNIAPISDDQGLDLLARGPGCTPAARARVAPRGTPPASL